MEIIEVLRPPERDLFALLSLLKSSISRVFSSTTEHIIMPDTKNSE